MKCEDTVAEVYHRATITCQATGIGGAVGVGVEWYRVRDKVHERLEDEATRELSVDKHTATMTFLELGE